MLYHGLWWFIIIFGKPFHIIYMGAHLGIQTLSTKDFPNYKPPFSSGIHRPTTFHETRGIHAPFLDKAWLKPMMNCVFLRIRSVYLLVQSPIRKTNPHRYQLWRAEFIPVVSSTHQPNSWRKVGGSSGGGFSTYSRPSPASAASTEKAKNHLEITWKSATICMVLSH